MANISVNTSVDVDIITTDIANTHYVDVGANGQFIFNPNNVDAAVGDLIIFRFFKLNHTVTQSSFEHPCTPNMGFDSGFSFYNPFNQTGIINQLFVFFVRDSEPTWFFCHQTEPQSHCAAGMRFGVNVGDMMDQFLAMPDSSINASYYQPRDSPSAFTQPTNWNDSRTLTAPGVFSTGYLSSGGLTGQYFPSTSVFSSSLQTTMATTMTTGPGVPSVLISSPSTTTFTGSGRSTHSGSHYWNLAAAIMLIYQCVFLA